jgi:hypothetical protein
MQGFGASVARFGTAAGLIAIANWVFDYPFTGWAIWHFGALLGGAMVLVLAPLLNYGIVHWYRRTTTDWFGLEWLRAQEVLASGGWASRVARSSLRKSRLVAFASLSAFLDPVYGFIYQRGRITGTRFTPRDWWWFGLANVLGILPWIFGASLAVEAVKHGIS